MLRSGKFRKRMKRVPGGRLAIHYSKRRPGIHICGSCGKPLHGTLRARTVKAAASSKTGKRPMRPYGGNLCSACTRLRFRNMVNYPNS